MKMIEFSTVIQCFFCEYLIGQKNVSTCTVASYRDTFKALFVFAEKFLNKKPSNILFCDITPDFILKFLDFLEVERENSIATRNVRLAAIKSFIKYATFKVPDYLEQFNSILAIPLKRSSHSLITFFTKEEVQAVLGACDCKCWSGFRDKVMFTVMYNTGGRVSEITNLKVLDVDVIRTKSIRLHGKGRKERIIPLWNQSVKMIKSWLKKNPSKEYMPFLPNRTGDFLTRSGVESRLKKCVELASLSCSSLKKKKISPHIFRHTAAMHLLQAGVNISVIALWLGHENITTTHMYMEADLAMKDEALKRIQPPDSITPLRFKPSDQLLEFLDSL